jgi:hypothetical protein
MSWTIKELEEAIEKWHEDHEEEESSNAFDDLYYTLDYANEGESLKLMGEPVSLVEQFGGEGQGDEWWVIIKVGERLFRINGWYASYNGRESTDIEEVKPVEYTATRYDSLSAS